MKKLLLLLISNYLFSYTVISHKPIDYFIPEYRLLIDANIKSFSSGVSSGKVHFRSDRNRDFFSIAMRCKGNSCQATLPAPSKEVDKLSYFISVMNTQGEIYKTQVFSVGQKTLPKWQVGTGKEPLSIYSTTGEKSLSKVTGFEDRIVLKESFQQPKKRAVKKVVKKAQESPNSEYLMPLDEYQLKGVPAKSNYQQTIPSKSVVDFSGVWVIKRSLSSCSSSLSSQKLIKIESQNGKIVADQVAPNGTKFMFNDKQGWFSCKLTDDSSQGYLVGESSSYNYYSFLKSLQKDLSAGESVRVLEFNRDKISFELNFSGEKLWTSYIRQPSSSFYRGSGELQPQ